VAPFRRARPATAHVSAIFVAHSLKADGPECPAQSPAARSTSTDLRSPWTSPCHSQCAHENGRSTRVTRPTTSTSTTIARTPRMWQTRLHLHQDSLHTDRPSQVAAPDRPSRGTARTHLRDRGKRASLSSTWMRAGSTLCTPWLRTRRCISTRWGGVGRPA